MSRYENGLREELSIAIGCRIVSSIFYHADDLHIQEQRGQNLQSCAKLRSQTKINPLRMRSRAFDRARLSIETQLYCLQIRDRYSILWLSTMWSNITSHGWSLTETPTSSRSTAKCHYTFWFLRSTYRSRKVATVCAWVFLFQP